MAADGCRIAVFGVADSAYLYQAAAGTYVEGRLVDIGWVLALVLLACAAWSPVKRIAEVRAEGWPTLTLPTTFAAIGLGLVYDHFQRLGTLALAGAASLAAVIGRAVLTFREKLRLPRAAAEALTDSLTGLGNRRRFMQEIEDDLREADVRHPLVLVLFDLDGFKIYNDTFDTPQATRCSSGSRPISRRRSRDRGGPTAWAVTSSACSPPRHGWAPER